MTLRLRLELELREVRPVAHRVAENLIAAGKILRRAMDVGYAVPCRRFYGGERVDQMRPCERHETRRARRHDGVDLVRRGDRADAHRREARLIADLIREWRLEHAAEHRFGVVHG